MSFLSDARAVSRALDRFRRRAVVRTGRVTALAPIEELVGALDLDGLARYVERQFSLAREAHDWVAGLADFECPFEPESNILCFRLRGDDAAQFAARDALIAEGSFHLSTAEVQGKRHLRAAFMNPDTSMEDVRRMIGRVRVTSYAL